MSAECRACKKPLVWARTPNGSKAPIERDPDPEGRGNVLLLQPDALGGAVLAVTLSGEMLKPGTIDREKLRLNHFAYCPERESFKKAS